MDVQLRQSLVKFGVREDIIHILVEEELVTKCMLESVSDELLRSIRIKAGQIVLIRKTVAELSIAAEKENEDVDPTINGPVDLTDCDFLPITINYDQSLSETTECSGGRDTPLPMVTIEIPTTKGIEPHVPHIPMTKEIEPHVSSPSCQIQIPTPKSKSSEYGIKPVYVKEERKPDEKWLVKYQLPTRFSPSVTAALEAQNLTGTVRDEFNRDVCAAIKIHTMNPKKHEREHVAFLIISKYPFLADKLGCGTASWEQSIKHRFKNERRTKKVKREAASSDSEFQCPTMKRSLSTCSFTLATNPSSSPFPSSYTSMLSTSKPSINQSLSTSASPADTNETCKEHIAELKKEMAKNKNRNLALVSELMDVTFTSRRQKILTSPATLKNIINEYPALGLVSELKAEFERVVKAPRLNRKMVSVFKKDLQTKLLSLAQKRLNLVRVRRLVKEMEEAIVENVQKKAEIEEDGSVLLLQAYLKDKAGSSAEAVIKICSDDESIDDAISSSVAPMLIGGGQCGSISPLYVAAEGNIIVKLVSTQLLPALALLTSVYYVFNIQYPNSGKNIYEFIEVTLLNNQAEARKRVSINRLLQDMENV